ncbi:uncharacterized protein [Physcomitrium patens]|uniref:Uncharacterized protein n=2 Tax=Physcomitrium patens TaxID=3218 RepID=A0A2K1L049_PHYPA|nr:uncharacterized protein LOC112279200 [Physcomitrium patens]PNR59402.1 hypothetical protein PHYPA_002193 [Physcomitrium patens]|eukprot:XP_024369174.1 uncharacterized protein LOC112279200 [Physcomitrella patens]
MAVHTRDIMGLLLLLLVITEATRKYMTIQDLARMQAQTEKLTALFEQVSNSQFAAARTTQVASRRLLAPSAVRDTEVPLLCQSPGMGCLAGEEVRCEMGRHEGCDCEYIRACFPRAAECTFFNATHITSCGF